MSLSMGTEAAKQLQSSIQNQLTARGYSSEAEGDDVMSEYITIMIVNSKTPEQVTSELADLIGAEYDSTFTDWLFAEAKRIQDGPDSTTSDPASSSGNTLQTPSQPRTNGPLPSSGTKRALSPSPLSPSGPSNKLRRTSELPDRPRAMREDPSSSQTPHNRLNNRSLIDRVAPPNQFQQQQKQPSFDPIQNQINAITMGGMNPNAPPFVPQGQMPVANPGMMQELLMNNMMMMGTMLGMNPQMAMQGMMMGGPGFMGGPQSQGFPNGFNSNNMNGPRRGPGGGRGGGRFEQKNGHAMPPNAQQTSAAAGSTPLSTSNPSASNSSPAIVAPTPIPVAQGAIPTRHPSGVEYPARPASPTLCKFGTNCTNPVCRYAHPSPAATTESGLVLSTEACEKGIRCEDKDCTLGHPSKAILNPNATIPASAPKVSKTPFKATSTPYASQHLASTHPYSRPTRPTSSTIPCRFGTNCTRANCTFGHPAGRTTLPGEFHRGLNANDPTVKLDAKHEKARMNAAAASQNRFNKTVDFRKKTANTVSSPVVTTDTPTQATPEENKIPDASSAALDGDSGDRASSVTASSGDSPRPVADASTPTPAVTITS